MQGPGQAVAYYCMLLVAVHLNSRVLQRPSSSRVKPFSVCPASSSASSRCTWLGAPLAVTCKAGSNKGGLGGGCFCSKCAGMNTLAWLTQQCITSPHCVKLLLVCDLMYEDGCPVQWLVIKLQNAVFMYPYHLHALHMVGL